MFISIEPIHRFMSMTDIQGADECWEWQGNLVRGYGQFKAESKLIVQAHRWAYEYFTAKIFDGLTIDHLCKNKRCVNPQHLEPVSIQENILRSTGPAALNAKKTHCRKGHPFDSINYAGRRICVTCRREYDRVWKAARRRR